jgi:hypothetical protein
MILFGNQKKFSRNTYIKKTMAKINYCETEFANEYTLRRRAWIAKALDSVRRRLAEGNSDFYFSEERPKSYLRVVDSDDVC